MLPVLDVTALSLWGSRGGCWILGSSVPHRQSNPPPPKNYITNTQRTRSVVEMLYFAAIKGMRVTSCPFVLNVASLPSRAQTKALMLALALAPPPLQLINHWCTTRLWLRR